MVTKTEMSRLTHMGCDSKSQQSTDPLRLTSIQMLSGSSVDHKVSRIVPLSLDRVRSVQWPLASKEWQAPSYTLI
jgi:hypothetical protein